MFPAQLITSEYAAANNHNIRTMSRQPRPKRRNLVHGNFAPKI